MTDDLVVPLGLRLARRDEQGRPVPWFHHVDDAGVVDLARIRVGGVRDAINGNLCWTCGKTRGRWATFVGHPTMIPGGGLTTEPPSHRPCAIWMARTFPYIAEPADAMRSEEYLGVTVAVSSKSWSVVETVAGLALHVGKPTEVLWFVGGALVEASVAVAEVEAERKRWEPDPPAPAVDT